MKQGQPAPYREQAMDENEQLRKLFAARDEAIEAAEETERIRDEAAARAQMTPKERRKAAKRAKWEARRQGIRERGAARNQEIREDMEQRNADPHPKSIRAWLNRRAEKKEQ